jgi:predicted CXXCH cytochrome family protein
MRPTTGWPLSWAQAVVLALLGVGTVLGIAFFVLRRPGRTPPASALERPSVRPSPFQNVRSGVRYVGDAACADCHADIAATYRNHPMGRDLSLVPAPAVRERYDRAAKNPFEQLGFRFQVEPRGERVVHRVECADERGRATAGREDAVLFAIGSGARGRSYVIDRDGFLFQSPISWYAEGDRWGLSPGFGRAHLGGLPVSHAVNIGCERCHGPGELHVERQQRGEAAVGPDDTIVNPGRLEPALREAVCQQCHFTTKYREVRRGRGTFDFRPGLPIQEFWTLFSQPAHLAEGHRHSSRVEQMAASRCFRASGGRLGCVSCHDPHAVPDPKERAAFYRDRCLRCHQETSCGLTPAVRRQRNEADSCAACHMPRQGSQKAAHVSDTDHRIPRVPEAAPPPRTTAVHPHEPLLIPFHGDLPGPGEAEVGRDLGLALSRVAEDAPALRAHACQQALPLLEEAVRRWPDDVPAWQAKARVLRALGRPQAAANDLRAALATAPDDEAVLDDAATLAALLGERATARDLWRRAAAVNPQSAAYRTRLAGVLADLRQWSEAVAECREALRLDPANGPARVQLVSCLLATGDRAAARNQFDILMATKPPNGDELRKWFAESLR